MNNAIIILIPIKTGIVPLNMSPKTNPIARRINEIIPLIIPKKTIMITNTIREPKYRVQPIFLIFSRTSDSSKAELIDPVLQNLIIPIILNIQNTIKTKNDMRDPPRIIPKNLNISGVVAGFVVSPDN
nr:hypothetical protein [uncultured Methanospirillum sp.]